jgi:Cyclin, N-terminal domain
MVELLERLEIMFVQEDKSYKTVDYLNPEFQSRLASVCDGSLIDPTEATQSSVSLSSTSSSSGINDIWREKICEWSYQVIDHFDFSREVVSISIHYLDRFLATRPCNKKVFQLAAMTSLFLAIKLYEPGKISMQSMIELSRGYFHVKQMEAMEISILRYVAPPSYSPWWCALTWIGSQNPIFRCLANGCVLPPYG